MGRGRLRRGYSLEVIFEEDSDICSGLDSLDSYLLPLCNNNRNSTAEEEPEEEDLLHYKIDDLDNLPNFTSLLSIQSNNHFNNQLNFEANGCKSLDGLLYARDMDSCYIEWDEFSSDSLLSKSARESEDINENCESRSTGTSGRRSRVSRRQIVEANWLIDDEDVDDNDVTNCTLNTNPISLTNSVSTSINFTNPAATSTNATTASTSPSGNNTNTSQDFFCTTNYGDYDPDISITNSSMTDETFAAIDTYDEVNSTISTNTTATSSLSIQLNGSNDKPSTTTSSHLSLTNNISKEISPACHSNSSIAPEVSTEILLDSNMDVTTSLTDVKRVRALFENSSCCSLENDTNLSWKKRGDLFQKKGVGKTSLFVENGINGSSEVSLSRRSSNSNSPLIRSAYSQLQLNQMEKYDFVDLLVNDKVIIEDSPDLFQKQRSRFQDIKGAKLTNKSPSPNSSRFSTLRRSKSVGAGLQNTDDDDSPMNLSSNEDMMRSRPCILAEELPAPDTVKNARTVFEKLVHKNKTPAAAEPSVIIISKQHENHNSKPQQPKLALSSIKSNPTSKILRSESMKDDSKNSTRFGKPILIHSYSNSVPIKCKSEETNGSIVKSSSQKSLSLMNGKSNKTFNSSVGNSKDKKVFEIGKDVKRESNFHSHQYQRAFGGVEKRKEVDEESNSFLSLESSTSTIGGDENEEPKLISSDILNRIRSYGTTTTYFGGEIVGKTVKNRNLVFPHSKSTESNSSSCEQPVEIVIAPPSNEIFFSPRPNQTAGRGDAAKSTISRYNNNRTNGHNSSGIDFESFRFMDMDSERFKRHDEDNIPRIISVEPKSQPNSPTKSNSPTIGVMMGSIIAEGRNSPEGCESSSCSSSVVGVVETSRTEAWINSSPAEQEKRREDGNNNCIKPCTAETPPAKAVVNGVERNENNGKKFSEAAEGAWF